MSEQESKIDSSLTPLNMLSLYARGAFPMADGNGRINWYQPDIRTVIPIDSFNYPRSLKKFISKSDWIVKFDYDPLLIVKHCAERDETWISAQLIEAYERLHKVGYLHSVAIFENDNLIGGLYGVTYRGAFFGESMFSKKSQASKVALIKLLERLIDRDFVLLDVQYQTDHLEMFGAVEIGFMEYMDLLVESYKRDALF